MDANLQQLRKAFKQHDQESTVLLNIKVGCVLGILLVPSFTILDYSVYPKLASEFLVARLVCSGLIGLCLVLLLRGVGKNYYYVWGTVLLLIPSSTIAYMIWRSTGAASPYYAGLNLVLLVLGFVLRWTLVESSMAVSIVALEYFAACRLHGAFDFKGVIVNNFYFLFATGVIVITGNHIFSQARYREFLARHQLAENKRELEAINVKLSEQNLALEKANREIKETEMQLVQSEKMSSLGRFSAGLMHDILNPLNYARTGLFVIRKKNRQLPPEALAEANATVDDIEDGLKRVQEIVSDLRTFTHPGGQEAEEVSLENLFNISLRFVSSELKERHIALKQDLLPGQKIWAGRNHFVLVLVNLLENAIDALAGKQFPPGEEPSIEISSRAEGERCLLVIHDNGPGIPAQNLAKVFDPFFTTKEIGKGTGLGLSICFGIVRGYGGAITARSEPGQYCEFILDLPVTAGAAARTESNHVEPLRL